MILPEPPRVSVPEKVEELKNPGDYEELGKKVKGQQIQYEPLSNHVCLL